MNRESKSVASTVNESLNNKHLKRNERKRVDATFLWRDRRSLKSESVIANQIYLFLMRDNWENSKCIIKLSWYYLWIVDALLNINLAFRLISKKIKNACFSSRYKLFSFFFQRGNINCAMFRRAWIKTASFGLVRQ